MSREIDWYTVRNFFFIVISSLCIITLVGFAGQYFTEENGCYEIHEEPIMGDDPYSMGCILTLGTFLTMALFVFAVLIYFLGLVLYLIFTKEVHDERVPKLQR